MWSAAVCVSSSFCLCDVTVHVSLMIILVFLLFTSLTVETVVIFYSVLLMSSCCWRPFHIHVWSFHHVHSFCCQSCVTAVGSWQRKAHLSCQHSPNVSVWVYGLRRNNWRSDKRRPVMLMLWLRYCQLLVTFIFCFWLASSYAILQYFYCNWRTAYNSVTLVIGAVPRITP